MLKEIKKEKDVITNQDLFNEIIKKVKDREKNMLVGMNKRQQNEGRS